MYVVVVGMLNEQFRQNPGCQLTSKHYYNNQITNGMNTVARQAEQPFPCFVFFDSFSYLSNGKFVTTCPGDNGVDAGDKSPQPCSGGTYNPFHTAVAVRIVQHLREVHGSDISLCIIVYYEKQKRYISRQLPTVDVRTVGSSQGAEFDFVIVCLGKHKDQTSFTLDPRRSCVFLSRARRQMILIGNRNFLNKDPMLSQIIPRADEHIFLRSDVKEVAPKVTEDMLRSVTSRRALDEPTVACFHCGEQRRYDEVRGAKTYFKRIKKGQAVKIDKKHVCWRCMKNPFVDVKMN